MPRCYSCGKFIKKPHREVDGRVERAYCDLCYAERDWKFGDDVEPLHVAPPPPLGWWERAKLFFGLA